MWARLGVWRTSGLASIERALEIALQAHSGQRDKGGHPYVLHPIRLMCRMATDEERITALLHDVVEDSEWTLDALRAEGFPPAIVAAVDHLTKRAGESYEAFIARVQQSPLATRIKIADLRDNLDASRVPVLKHADVERITKYQRALSALTGGTRS